LRGRGKGLGVGQPDAFFMFEEVYLAYYFLTRREVHIHLLNEKLGMSSILTKEMGKG